MSRRGTSVPLTQSSVFSLEISEFSLDMRGERDSHCRARMPGSFFISISEIRFRPKNIPSPSQKNRPKTISIFQNGFRDPCRLQPFPRFSFRGARKIRPGWSERSERRAYNRNLIPFLKSASLRLREDFVFGNPWRSGSQPYMLDCHPGIRGAGRPSTGSQRRTARECII